MQPLPRSPRTHVLAAPEQEGRRPRCEVVGAAVQRRQPRTCQCFCGAAHAVQLEDVLGAESDGQLPRSVLGHPADQRLRGSAGGGGSPGLGDQLRHVQLAGRGGTQRRDAGFHCSRAWRAC